MAGAKIDILVVEDETDHVAAVQRSLRRFLPDATARYVGSLKTYREALAVRQPDIALMDLNLPDGRALDEVTSPVEDGPFPVILMTSYGNEETVVEAIKSGVLDYIVKSPEAFVEIGRVVERALREWTVLRQRKEATEALQRSRAELKAIYDSAPVMMCVVDGDRKILYANHIFLKFVGVPEPEIWVGRACGCMGCINAIEDPRGCGFGPKCGKCGLKNAIDDTFQTGTVHSGVECSMTFERAGVRKEVILRGATARVQSGGVRHVLLCLDDVTEPRKAELALKESELRYRDLVNSIDDIILSFGLDGIITFVNPAVTKLTGYAVKEVMGRHVSKFIVLEDRPVIMERMMALQGGAPAEPMQYRIITKAGDTRWIEAITKISSIHGVNSFSSKISDITPLKEAQAQKEALAQADKMIALGTLVSGVAHEINNPNNFIMMNGPMLGDIWNSALPILEDYRKSHGDFNMAGLAYSEMKEEVPDLIQGIVEGSTRIKRIVDDLKRFARMEPPDLSQEVDINEVVNGAVSLLGAPLRAATNHFSTKLAPDLPRLRGSFQRIEQVIINLIQNSCQALANKDQAIEITTGYIEDADSIFIRVRDGGKGIAREDLERITNPFFTTKRASGGTGLGLSVSMGIVKDHGGGLSFDSTPGKGTTAVVVFPVSKPLSEGEGRENLRPET